MAANKFERGAEWRQWDLHIHTPASFHWHGKGFEADASSPANAALVDEMIAALNAAEPAVFAVMDYWTFDGWFALKRRLKELGAPHLKKRVFPGIELRLAAPTTCRLNAHVLFSDEVDDQVLHDFKSALTLEIVPRPLSDASLIELARSITEDKLKLHGFKKAAVDADSGKALVAGSTIAEINCDSYKTAIEKVPKDRAIGFMPYDTSDGLAEVKWQEHYAYFLGLFKSSPIFETRNSDPRAAFVGEKTVGNTKWFENFQADLGNIPRLAGSGSDAHRFTGVSGDNDKRGYGDFPSSKATWIKAERTATTADAALAAKAKAIQSLRERLRITQAVNWKGGGGFRYYRLAPSLLEKDKWGNWVINKEYNAAMLAEALCKLEGFTYAPSDSVYWQHGRSTERDFIYVTTAKLGHEQLQQLGDEVGQERSLLVLCTAFRGRADYPNLTVKKIPKQVLSRCEWGHDDYSLRVENLPQKPPEPGQQALFGDEIEA